MSVITTPLTKQDIDRQVRASVLDVLTNHVTMDKAVIEGCLDGSVDDVAIASRIAIVVIARTQKLFDIKDLVDPRKLRPEEVTSVLSVTRLIIEKLSERLA